MEDNAKLISKIQKLLNLGDASKNTFEAEALAAITKAKKMMADNGLEMCDIETTGSENYNYNFTEKPFMSKNKFRKWVTALALVTDQLCGTKSYIIAGKPCKVFITGTESDITLAKALYKMLYVMIETKSMKEFPGKGTTVQRRSYAEGFVSRLLRRAKESVKMETPTRQERYDLVVIGKKKQHNEWFAETCGIMVRNRRSTRKIDSNAYNTGYSHGGNVNIHNNTNLT